MPFLPVQELGLHLTGSGYTLHKCIQISCCGLEVLGVGSIRMSGRFACDHLKECYTAARVAMCIFSRSLGGFD